MKFRWLIIFAVSLCSLQEGISQSTLLNPGMIGSSQTISYNTAPEPLTELSPATGGTGDYSYQWQASGDGTVWADIAGATSSGYSPPALSASTWYRRMVNSGTLEPVASEPVMITVLGIYLPVDSLFRSEVPVYIQNNLFFELGSEFQVMEDGYITKARLYSHMNEGGDHTVRLWSYNGTSYTLLSGPYTWNFSSGYQGWREYSFPAPVAVSGGGTYIISISTSSDNYFMYRPNILPYAHGRYLSYQRGVYTTASGGVPIYVSGNSCYYRDVVFAMEGESVLSAGMIRTSQTISYNTAPEPLTELSPATGGTGDYSYQWQASGDGTVWADIAGATSSGYSPPALSASTWYRRMVSSGALEPVASEPVMITVLGIYLPVDSLFRSEVPVYIQNNLFFELGSEFQVMEDGYITKARLYSHMNEGGDHTVRLWSYNGTSYTLLSGPYTWNFSSGYQGWREYSFPAPVAVSGGGTYIISISTSSDNYFMYRPNILPYAHGRYLSYQRGVYTTTSGGVPIYVSGNSCYYRDVVFAMEGGSVLSAGMIGTSQTISYNTAPEPLTELSPATGGTGDYSYQWQASGDGTVWADIAGATSSGYSPPALSASTWYRRMVGSGTLEPVASEPVMITVLGIYLPVDSLFRSEVPVYIQNNLFFELGSEFQVMEDGYITKARLYSHMNEGGDHTVRLWSYNGTSYTLLSGPYTWNFSSGYQGWREYSFPAPVAVSGGGTYIISISASSDNYFMYRPNILPYAHGRYLSYQRGVYTTASGGVPIYVSGNSCYYRDVVFAFSGSEIANAGTIGTSQLICGGNVPEPLTELTPVMGGMGDYRYQWQSSADSIFWTDIVGATSTGYSPPALSQTTWYRRGVVSGLIGPEYSDTVRVSVENIQAQLFGNITIENNESTDINTVIVGGIPPYTLNYSRNGIPQTEIRDYVSGSAISTGNLISGIYTYEITALTDSHGCQAVNLGVPVTVTVTTLNSYHYDFTYPDRASLIADGWDFIGKNVAYEPRNTESVTGAVVSYDQQAHPGVLRIPVDEGDIWGDLNNSRNTLFRDLPSTWSSIRLKISRFNPLQNYQSAGLMYYQNDNNYIMISRSFNDINRILFTSEELGGPQTLSSLNENAIVDLYLRLDRNAFTEEIGSFYSLNGTDWIQLGSTLQRLPRSPRLGIICGGSQSGLPDADIAWVEIETMSADELHAYPKDIVFNAIQGQAITDVQSVYVYTTLDRSIPWSQTTDVPWLLPNIQSGVTEGKIQVGVNTSGMSRGVHIGNITVTSPLSILPPVVVPITVIINEDMPVRATDWLADFAGVMSVSVDNGDATAFTELQTSGFTGSYYSNGLTPPPYYTTFYNAGMELGSHLTDHDCTTTYPESILRSREIEQSIQGIAANTPQPYEDLITLAWPCGVSNYHMEGVASEYFLAARGYNFNQLEDPNPENFMNLKSYNSHNHEPFPPSDLRTVVDLAITEHKWFNLVLHESMLDDGAIYYARNKNIWVTSIGKVVKYIYQRERMILTNFSSDSEGIGFNATRLSIPSSPIRDFEDSFNSDDVTTLMIDIDDVRITENVLIAGVANPYQLKDINGNIVLLTNIRLEPGVEKSVEVNYLDESIPRIILSPNPLIFNIMEGENSSSQTFTISSNLPAELNWIVTLSSNSNWLSVSPVSGTGNQTITVSVNSSGLSVGDYSNTLVISSDDAFNSPQTKNVSLSVTPSGMLHFDFIYPDRNSLLTDGWDFIAESASGGPRNTEQTEGAVVSFDQELHPGVIRIPVDLGSLWLGLNDTRNSLFRDLPTTWTSIRLKVAAFAPTQNYQSVSLIAYQDDNNYIELSRGFNDGQIMALVSEDGASYPTSYSVNLTSTSNLYYRLDRDQSTNEVFAYYSLNGSDWNQIGETIVKYLTNPRLGIVAGGSSSGFPIADIEWAEVMFSSVSNKSLRIESATTSIKNVKLYQNYPNPFNEFTRIEYELERESHIILEVYNSVGKQVKVLVNQYQSAGRYSLTWTPENLTSGAYYLVLKTPGSKEAVPMYLVR